LERDLEITGPITIKLYAASSAPDTDFTAMLLDVQPDGVAVRLTDGIVRASFRNSLESPTLLAPGRVYEYRIDCWNISMRLAKGHRIRVHLASAAFPKFNRNPNTGHGHGVDAETKVAKQTIYHDRLRPSHIILPIIWPDVRK